jgi:hypothetical protein
MGNSLRFLFLLLLPQLQLGEGDEWGKRQSKTGAANVPGACSPLYDFAYNCEPG